MELHVLIEERRWLEINLRKILSGVIKSVLSFLNNCESNYEISLLASNDKNISELNKKYRNVTSATNILSCVSSSLKASMISTRRPPAVKRIFMILAPRLSSSLLD